MSTRKGEAPARGATRMQHVPVADLHKEWKKLHQGDREPWPDARCISRWSHGNPVLDSWIQAHAGSAAVAVELQKAWGFFHGGMFKESIRLGSQLGALGAAVANKAAAIQTLYRGDGQAERLLEAAIERGESAVRQLDTHANTHYTLALVLGRYSQRISILKAVAQGFAGRVRDHLERAIALEPQHAEAHLALGLYNAELLSKLGSLAASLTYGVSAKAALDHFQHALKFAPASPIVHIEYANGLLLLDRERHAARAAELYAQAATFEPLDEMERQDIERARRGING